MSAIRDLTDLKDVYTATGPFVTVHLDASRNDETAVREIPLRWRAVRERLAGAGADERTLDAVGARIEGHRHPGRHGLLIVAASGRVLLDDVTSDPPGQPLAEVSALPHLMPFLAEHSIEPSVLLVVTDHHGADLRANTRDGVVTREVSGSQQHPLHKVGDDDWSVYHFQNRVQNAWKENARDVAEAVTDLARRTHPDLVVVAGEQQSRSMLLDQLGGSLGDSRVVGVDAGSRAAGASGQSLDAAVAAAVQRAVESARHDLLERLEQDLGRRQHASAGIGPVVDALRRAAVDTLVITEDGVGAADAWVGESAAEFGLDEREADALGVRNPRHDRLDAALVRAAVQTGARIVITPGSHAVVPDGVAALLRS